MQLEEVRESHSCLVHKHVTTGARGDQLAHFVWKHAIVHLAEEPWQIEIAQHMIKPSDHMSAHSIC